MPPITVTTVTVTDDHHNKTSSLHDEDDSASSSSSSVATYPSADGSPVRRSGSFWSLPGSVLAAPSTAASPSQSMLVGRSETGASDAGFRAWVGYGSEGRRREILENESRWLIETLHPKLVAVEAAFRRYEDAFSLERDTSNTNSVDDITSITTITASNNNNHSNIKPTYKYEEDDSTYVESQPTTHHHHHHLSSATTPSVVQAAARHADDTMLAHRLRVEAFAFVASPPPTTIYHPEQQKKQQQEQRIRFTWTMYMGCSHHQQQQQEEVTQTQEDSKQQQRRQNDDEDNGDELVVGRGVVDTEEELYTAGFYAGQRKALEV